MYRCLRANDRTNTYQYFYCNGNLVSMTYNGSRLYFAYTPDGLPYGVEYGGTQYVYALNLQGDVVAILDASGAKVAEYTYDAWGYILSVTGSMADTLGQINPLRYRGYVYDNETQLYFLQSRYYDPEIGRFINSDGQISSPGGEILGNNMYAYCQNNPVNMSDATGCWPTWNDVINAAKRAVDGLIQTAIAKINPISTIVGVALHYSRNLLNDDSYSEEELIEKGYTHEDEKSDKFHQNKQRNGGRNRKYVVGEWFSSEVVYYSDGTLNNEPEDRGTFNVYSGSDPIKNVVIHGVFDVIPYMVWGNSLDDSTTIIDRVIMIWE